MALVPPTPLSFKKKEKFAQFCAHFLSHFDFNCKNSREAPS
jgi:hypothetical protein